MSLPRALPTCRRFFGSDAYVCVYIYICIHIYIYMYIYIYIFTHVSPCCSMARAYGLATKELFFINREPFSEKGR